MEFLLDLQRAARDLLDLEPWPCQEPASSFTVETLEVAPDTHGLGSVFEVDGARALWSGRKRETLPTHLRTSALGFLSSNKFGESYF